MPGRKVVLVNNQIYHILNRGVAKQSIFLQKQDYQRALETLFYYQNKNLPFRYSYFLAQTKDKREEIHQLRKSKKFLVSIIAYCLMPNHFHFLLKQTAKKGISKFMSNFSNSYARYFNKKNKRQGPVFQGRFRAVRIETEEQLLHVNRYIHLNPYTSYVVKNWKDLESYPYSSLPEYLKETKLSFCQKEVILSHFKSKQAYKKFVFDQADYQRQLEKIKHLSLEI